MPSTQPSPPGDLRSLAGDAAGAGPPRPPYPWKTRLLLPALLVAGLLASFAVAAGGALWPATPVHVVPVVVKASTQRAAGGGVVAQAAGWLEADPYPINVTALADGVVEEVLVLEGEPVKAGQVLARLVDDDARLALQRAEAQLATAEADLDAARLAWENPVERDRAVAAGEAAVEGTLAEMQRLEAEVAAETARLAELAEDLERARRNYQSGAGTELEFITARLRHEAQQAALKATQARRPVLEAQRRGQEADLAAARKDRELRIPERQALALAEAALARGQVERAEAALRLERMEVRSPVDGVVLSREMEPGSKLMLGMDDPLSATAVRLYDPQKLQVRVDVPLADAASVGVGMTAEVVVDVLPDEVFRGRVTRVVQEADIAKNTLQVKVAIEAPSASLKPEMLARVRFLAPAGGAPGEGGSEQVVFAPESLIDQGPAGTSAWVVDRRADVARRAAVEVGTLRQDGWVAVVSGLSPGDRLIADTAGLKDGARVRVIGEAEAAQAMKGGDDGVH